MGEARRRRQAGATNQALALDQDAAAVAADHERDDGERLAAMLRLLPPEKRGRFASAAQQAGCALELLKPGLVAPTTAGMVAGVFSRARAGEALLVAAGPRRSVYCPVPVDRFDELAAAAEDHLSGPGCPPEVEAVRREGSMLVLAAKLNLERYGRDATADEDPGLCLALPLVGAMLASAEHRRLLRSLAARGPLVPAAVCLLAEDGRGAVLFPLIHGRPWPAIELAEAA